MPVLIFVSIRTQVITIYLPNHFSYKINLKTRSYEVTDMFLILFVLFGSLDHVLLGFVDIVQCRHSNSVSAFHIWAINTGCCVSSTRS